MKLSDIQFPVYVVHTDDVVSRDGILWCEGQVIDDKNVSGKTIGKRRLSTPYKNLYSLRIMLEDYLSMFKHGGKNYVDSSGKFFRYEKSMKANLIYKKIRRVEKKDVLTLVWVDSVPFPFEVKRPPQLQFKYAGILYINKQPSYLYNFSTDMKKTTWRKI
jgi:hypothetical protein